MVYWGVRLKSTRTARTKGEACGGRGIVAEVDVEVLALHRPAVAERVLIAGAHRPSVDPVRLLETGRCLGAEDPPRKVDLRPGSAAGDVEHRLVPDGPAEAAAGRRQPTLLQLGAA